MALEQLINNAVKYTNSGTIKIVCSEGQLKIQDSGIGILPEDLPRLFDHGFTGFNGRANEKSSGLGLYLTKLILDKLDFQIKVSSEIDKGTEIYILK